MKTRNKIVALSAAALVAATVLSGCTAAGTVSSNLSTAADNFEIQRRITFYNGITGENFLAIEGRCSIEVDEVDGQLEVTCKIGEDEYIKDFLGLSDNVTYYTEQLETADVSLYHYNIIVRPEALIPGLQLDTGKQ